LNPEGNEWLMSQSLPLINQGPCHIDSSLEVIPEGHRGSEAVAGELEVIGLFRKGVVQVESTAVKEGVQTEFIVRRAAFRFASSL